MWTSVFRHTWRWKQSLQNKISECQTFKWQPNPHWWIKNTSIVDRTCWTMVHGDCYVTIIVFLHTTPVYPNPGYVMITVDRGSTSMILILNIKKMQKACFKNGHCNRISAVSLNSQAQFTSRENFLSCLSFILFFLVFDLFMVCSHCPTPIPTKCVCNPIESVSVGQ